MVFAFSANAFAAPASGTGTIIISSVNYGGPFLIEDVSSGQTVKDALLNIDAAYGGIGVDFGPNQAGDWLLGIMGEYSTPSAMYDPTVENSISYYFSPSTCYFTWYFDGYGTFTGGAPYNEFYAGYDWVFSVDRSGNTFSPTVPMGQFTIEDGDVIMIDYDLLITVWYGSDPGISIPVI
jgi:hypothetical protein